MTLSTNSAKTFLTEAYRQRSLFHGYIFTGPDIQAQYDLAMYTGQLLNCEAPLDVMLSGDPSASPQASDSQRINRMTGEISPCGLCRSCKWILNAAHPIVNVMSRLTFETEDTDPPKSGERKTISTKQIAALRKILSHKAAPQEYRILIFTDALKKDIDDTPVGAGPVPARRPVYPAPFEWRENEANASMTLEWQPITQQLFSGAAANAFLKNLEEPHPQTHYFFLTHQADALLDTIVSRCQTLYVPPTEGFLAGEKTAHLHPRVNDWLNASLHPLDSAKVERYSKGLETVCKEEGLTPVHVLRDTQSYLHANHATIFQGDVARYLKWQQGLHTAIDQLNGYCNVSYVLWNLLHQLQK